MSISSQMRNKFMTPLKMALLTTALGLPPGKLENALDKASEQSLNTATEKILDAMSDQATDILNNWGPQVQPQTPPSDELPPQNQPQGSALPVAPEQPAPDFPAEQDNGIMDDKNVPPSSESERPKQTEKAPGSEQQSKSNDKKENTDTSEEEDEKDKKEETEEPEEEPKEPENKLPDEKGILMKSFNAIRNRQKIKELTKQVKKIEKDIKSIQRNLAAENIKLQALNVQKLSKKSTKAVIDVIRKILRVFNCCCGCCILGFIVPATILLRAFLNNFSHNLERRIKEIDAKIASIKDRIEEFKGTLTIRRQTVEPIYNQLYSLINQDLLANKSQENNTPPSK